MIVIIECILKQNMQICKRITYISEAIIKRHKIICSKKLCMWTKEGIFALASKVRSGSSAGYDE